MWRPSQQKNRQKASVHDTMQSMDKPQEGTSPVQHILAVDDEPAILKLIEYNLTHAGFEVTTATDGMAAVKAVRTRVPDLVILDLMLPGMDGLQVCQTLRREGYQVPVIMVTARDDEVDRILGLELGADDYVTKPFSPRELTARVKAVLRRGHNQATGEPAEQVSRVGDIVIDETRHEVKINQERIELTTREFELLLFLCQHPEHVLTRNQLLESVWGYDYDGDTRIVDVHISHLREKVEEDPKAPKYIRTVRGVGYKLTTGGT